jgi:hypothetical protein
MHRYIPIIASKEGFANIGEKVVVHQKRKYGITKFGLDRFVKGYLDLLSLYFISKFSQRPMHFFGLIGTLMLIIGFLSTAWIGWQKIHSLSIGTRAPLVTDSPYFYIALTMMLIGVQLFLTGFIAELISRNSTRRNKYQIRKVL